ncbi:Dam family site-specific DNA-(adenine-N6)-methyltransferase [Salmonella enterica]|nr:Dam family site-specific DNA-(adenine-N6)-methyltransferase [Salmonella enterica]
MIRSFLKWPGGKARVMPELQKHLPAGDCLVEPFVGGATVFLNTDYRRYVLGDINPDLINTYRVARRHTEALIDVTNTLFRDCGTEEEYYKARAKFNELRKGDHRALALSEITRAALFIYLNRHCFNGVVRYSERAGFNAPYAKDQKKAPYLPDLEIRQFAEKANDTKALFLCCSFENTLQINIGESLVIYCDPPYLPASKTSNFTEYYGGAFGAGRHRQLSAALTRAADAGCRVVLSNSDTPATREIYSQFAMHEISVTRSIAANGKRGKVGEVIATRNASGLGCPSGGCSGCDGQIKCFGLGADDSAEVA